LNALSTSLQPFNKCLTTLAICFRSAVRVRKQRRNVACIRDCMVHWQFAGRAFVAMRSFATRIRKLQRWWRSSSKRLREIREKISARWEEVEKVALAEEDRKRQESYTKSGARFWGQPSTIIPEAIRNRFIDHELRARRVALLPLLYIWEEDARRWRKDFEEWRETQAAHKALGHRQRTAFRWPPMRPSFVPPAHPNHQAWGSQCSEDCPGRRGDAEILEMWRICRKEPKGREGSKKIPCANSSKKQGTPKDSDAAKGKSVQRGSKAALTRTQCWGGSGAACGDSAKEGTSTSLLWEAATDEELRQWGVDARALPGL